MIHASGKHRVVAVTYLFEIYTLISFQRLWVESNAPNKEHLVLKQNKDCSLLNQWGFFLFLCPTANLALNEKSLTLYGWLDATGLWDFVLPLLSTAQEGCPSALQLYPQQGAWGPKWSPLNYTEQLSAALWQQSTNGYDVCVRFSVNHSLPAWCVSPQAILIRAQPPQ